MPTEYSLLVYKQSLGVQEFLQLIIYLLVETFLDVKAGGFNYGLLKVTDRKPLNNLIGYYQIKNKPTHISVSFLC